MGLVVDWFVFCVFQNPIIYHDFLIVLIVEESAVSTLPCTTPLSGMIARNGVISQDGLNSD